MADVFGNDRNIRGCFTVLRMDTSASHGAVLKMPSRLMPSNFSDPFVVVGFSAAQAEAVSYTKVFGGRVYTYAFGHDPNASWLNVDIMGFLVNKTRQSRLVNRMNVVYKRDRVSSSLEYAKLGIGIGLGDTPLRGFVVGIQTQTADPMHSLQRYTIRLALVEAQ